MTLSSKKKRGKQRRTTKSMAATNEDRIVELSQASSSTNIIACIRWGNAQVTEEILRLVENRNRSLEDSNA